MVGKAPITKVNLGNVYYCYWHLLLLPFTISSIQYYITIGVAIPNYQPLSLGNLT